jgi:hypothetical protein
MKKTALSLSMLMLAVFLLVAPAYADTLNLSLASPIQSGTPNGTLTFNARRYRSISQESLILLHPVKTQGWKTERSIPLES